MQRFSVGMQQNKRQSAVWRGVIGIGEKNKQRALGENVVAASIPDDGFWCSAQLSTFSEWLDYCNSRHWWWESSSSASIKDLRQRRRVDCGAALSRVFASPLPHFSVDQVRGTPMGASFVGRRYAIHV